ncbi:MAG: Uma2 family endonuclease [Xanthobacteraceae bacterium]
MTVDEYFSFTDARPDNEKWELIDGEPILNASPSGTHHRILKNLIFLLAAAERARPESWEAIPGIGVRVSTTSLPEPDVMILAAGAIHRDPYGRQTADVIATFEILSPSTADRDLHWKRTAYTGLPSLTHYVVIAQDVVVFARELRFAERRLRSLRDSLEISALGISLPLVEIYRNTGLQ